MQLLVVISNGNTNRSKMTSYRTEVVFHYKGALLHASLTLNPPYSAFSALHLCLLIHLPLTVFIHVDL